MQALAVHATPLQKLPWPAESTPRSSVICRIDTRVQQAHALQLRAPAAAVGRWAAIDRELVDKAPWVPLYNPRDLTVLSARVGNYQFHPYWSMLIDQLWVR